MACSPTSGTLYSEKPLPQQAEPEGRTIPDQVFDWITEDGGQSQLDFNPQVDILFVTDNSDSMKTAQENLGNNLNKFTQGIMSNKMIDYHIGTVSVWDSSERFLTHKKDSYKMGELRFVRDSKGQQYNKRFVTKKENASVLLAPTLKIGIAPLAQGGPENEELFSPLLAAIEKTGRGDTNEDFFRPDAQLVVILLTDADDDLGKVKEISANEVAQRLIAFKGGNSAKVSVYGVLARASDPDSAKDYGMRILFKYHPECFDAKGVKLPEAELSEECKTGFAPKKLEELVARANAVSGTDKEIQDRFIMSIVGDFGKGLGKIGSDITKKTLEKEIFLSHRPRVEKTTGEINLRVRYGTPAELAKGKGQVIPLATENQEGWLYNAKNNSVILSGEIKYQYSEGARFAVDLIPLNY
jgi:hypothetical protein